MSVEAQNFLTGFHNVPGGTVKEKQTNFFKFLHRNISLKNQQETLDFISDNLQATCHLERIFRTDFLIYFRRFTELYRDFKTGDEITLCKLSRENWFFLQAFKDVGAHELINEVLPSLSYSLKVRILKKLPGGETADAIFDGLCDRYGVFFPTVFLAKCTKNKISETLRKYPIKLTTNQLKLIYAKDPELLCVYFDERVRHLGDSGFMNNDPIWVFLAQNNPQLFSKLFVKYKFEISLGRRTTKNYIKSQKSQVLAEAKSFINVLNSAAIVRKLGPEIRFILFENGKNSQPYWSSHLKFFPKNHQFEIFRSVYDLIHYKKFGSDIETISEEILKLIPDVEEREKYAKLLYEKSGKLDYIQYFSAQFFLQYFLEKIDFLKSDERARFVKLAVNCCNINNDLDTLLKICELLCNRLKNDGDSSLSFLYALCDNPKIVDQFTKIHWKFVYEIMAIEQSNRGSFYNKSFIWKKHVVFLVENGLDLRPFLAESDTLFYCYDMRNNTKVFRAVVCELLESGDPNPEGENDSELYDCQIAAFCKLHNDEHDSKIEVWTHPRVLNSVKKILEDETVTGWDYWVELGIAYVICRKTTNKEVKNLYFKRLECVGNIYGLNWFLQHEPETIEQNLDLFLNRISVISHRSVVYWRQIKKLSFLNIGNRVIDFCQKKLRETKFERSEVRDLVWALTLVAPSDVYLNYLKTFIPNSPKVDLTVEETKNLYSVQCTLVRYSHYTVRPEALFPVALQFCTGDYLHSGLGPVYSCLYKTPEIDTKKYLSEIREIKAVSVKKHALHLSCVVCDVGTNVECFKMAPDCQMDVLKYFAKNPNPLLWDLLEKQVCQTGEKSLDVFKWMLNVTVPGNYRCKFFEIIWNVLDSFKNTEIKNILIKKIDKNCIEGLNHDIAGKIVKETLFKFEEGHDCIANLLIHTGAKFEYFGEILKDFKKSRWGGANPRPARRQLLNFVQILFKNYLKSDRNNEKFVSQLSDVFQSVFSLSEAFVENILISCMFLKGQNVENCAKTIKELNKTVACQYGNVGVNFLGEVLKNRVMSLLFPNDRMKLCHYLLEIQDCVNDYILIIKLIPDEPKRKDDFLLYEKIIKDLSHVTDNEVQLLLNLLYSRQ
ncbi:uncharacterized protein LOC123016303 [Tribolium madens]|uniref:uncharacterized protein LOC123016303 n=1 Tax=Tribolium madens TaxID=41895 RepID=UPI001CF7593F|nr:uncharacterized protein LOC123016303 [Tribolium madens]